MHHSATHITRRLHRLLNAQGNREWQASLLYAGMAIWFEHNELPGSHAWCMKHSEEERRHAFKIFNHLALRRIETQPWAEEEGSKGTEEGATEEEEEGLAHRLFRSLSMGRPDTPSGEPEGATESVKAPLETEEPPLALPAFRWARQSNIKLDVSGAYATRFEGPVHVWKTALEQERLNSQHFFEMIRAAREARDYVSEQFLMGFFIPEQLEEENAVEEILSNTMLVTKDGPMGYFLLDKQMHAKPH